MLMFRVLFFRLHTYSKSMYWKVCLVGVPELSGTIADQVLDSHEILGVVSKMDMRF